MDTFARGTLTAVGSYQAGGAALLAIPRIPVCKSNDHLKSVFFIGGSKIGKRCVWQPVLRRVGVNWSRKFGADKFLLLP